HLCDRGPADRADGGGGRLAARLCPDARARHDRDQEPDDRRDPPPPRLLVPALHHRRRCGARLLAGGGLLSCPQGLAPLSRRHHPGGDVTGAATPSPAAAQPPGAGLLIAASGVTRVLPGIVPVTLVHDIDLAIGANELVAITGPS